MLRLLWLRTLLALTIFLWILFGMRGPLGYIDKVIEVALIVLLLLDARSSGSS